MLERLRPLLKEPLIHFLVMGALIFLAVGTGDRVDPESRTMTVNEAEVKRLSQKFESVWQRAPSQKEIDRLIRDYIREEIYYREALRMGLDENDPIIRRRLRRKMEALATTKAQSAMPSDAELQAILDKEPEKYAANIKISFEQIWIGNDGDGIAALAKIKDGTAPGEIAKPISLPAKMTATPSAQIDREFGTGFAAQLADFKHGEWAGPVDSGFGKHLVKITNIESSGKPRLSDVRQRIENDWRAANVDKHKEAAFQILLDDYEIKIQGPE